MAKNMAEEKALQDWQRSCRNLERNIGLIKQRELYFRSDNTFASIDTQRDAGDLMGAGKRKFP